MPVDSSETKTAHPRSDFTPGVADLICQEIAKGRSLRAICVDEAAEFDGIPSERTVYRWLEEQETFRQQYARAREAQADGKFEQAWDIAQAATPESVQVARLQIDTIKWQTGKLAPKKYGDKVELEHTGSVKVTRVELVGPDAEALPAPSVLQIVGPDE